MARFRKFLLMILALLSFAVPGAASAPRYPDIMPLSQVKPGMRGYGLTVFRGTKIERFDVAIVGVVKKGSLVAPGRDMILVRLFGGPITSRHAYLIRGMSGSPVYVNGKIIGAFSQGEPTAKEPLGGVTPIEDMLEAWDPRLPNTPLAQAKPDSAISVGELKEPVQIAGRTIRKIVSNAPLSSGLRSAGDTLVLHPCTTFATFNSPSKVAREKLAKALEPYNVELVKGAASGADPSFKGAPLVPGAAFAMMLVTGDMSVGATGTVTYRRANRILGFGHLFMNIGPIKAPLASSYIYDVYPLLSGSYKISSFGPVVGVSEQDTMFAVSGSIGKQPQTIPITVDVKDKTTGRAKVFHAQAVTHPNLFAAMVSATVGAAVSEIRSTPGPAMATVSTSVDAEEIGKVTRTNVCFDSRGIDGAAVADLDDFLSIITSNPFYPVGLKSATVKVEIESGRKTAQVERVFLKEGKFQPGETAQIGVVIKPYKQPAQVKTITLKLPENTPSGRYILQVRGGAVPAGISFGGMILRPGGNANTEQAPPANIQQMVSRYEEKEKQNDLVVRLALLSTSVNVEGERLSNLPPSLDALMRSSKTSGVKLERDELKVVQPTDWVVSGQQLIAFSVQRKDSQESPSGGATAPSFPPGSGGQALAQGDSGSADDETASAPSRGFPVDPDGDLKVVAGNVRVDDTEKPVKSKKDDSTRNGKVDPKVSKKSDAKAGTDATSAVDQQTVPVAPATASDQPTTEKPVGRQPVTWRQTSRTDFAKGETDGVAVTTGGDLTLTRRLKPMVTSTESFVWSLIPDGKGGLFIGTGTQGAVMKVSPDGKVKTLARLPEVSVHGLALLSNGELLAGTGPHGRIYRIQPDGKFGVVKELAEKYVLALAQDEQGKVYAATGGGVGRIYRIDSDGKVSELYTTPEDHILSLAVDKHGVVYAGTSPNGIVYRITPDGKATALYDTAEASITGIGVNRKGEVFASTAPRGIIYKISEDGTPTTLFDKAAGPFSALRVASDDTVFASSGGTVYVVRPDDKVAVVDNKSDIDILALATDAEGRLYAGTGNVAEIFLAEPPAGSRGGAYTSVVHDAKQVSRWGTIRWTASTPGSTRLSVQTRTGSVAEPDASWSAWQSPTTGGDGAQIASPAGRYIQYKVAMSGEGATTPTLRDVAITYLPKNQTPKVSFQAPAGGERWAGNQTIRWEGSDPDKDTLNYDVYYSADNGLSWSPLPADGKPVAPAAGPKVSVTDTTAQKGSLESKVPIGSGPPSVQAVQAELDKHPDLPPSMREAILARAAKVNAEVAGDQATAPSGAAATAVQKQTNRTFDTKLLPDGVYVLKVVASDRVSNASDPMTAEAVSEPVTICNSLPSVLLFKDAITIDNGSFLLKGSAVQPHIALTGVQYRVDGGDWISAVAKDGIFDTSSETFHVVAGRLAPGRHTIEVKAFNAAGLTGTDKLVLEVK